MKNKLDIAVTKRVLAQYPFFKGFLDSFSLIPQKLKNNNADILFGSRFLDKNNTSNLPSFKKYFISQVTK